MLRNYLAAAAMSALLIGIANASDCAGDHCREIERRWHQPDWHAISKETYQCEPSNSPFEVADDLSKEGHIPSVESMEDGAFPGRPEWRVDHLWVVAKFNGKDIYRQLFFADLASCEAVRR